MCSFDFKPVDYHCPGCQCVKHCPGCKCKPFLPEDWKITWVGPKKDYYKEYYEELAKSIQKIIDAGKQIEDLQDKT